MNLKSILPKSKKARVIATLLVIGVLIGIFSCVAVVKGNKADYFSIVNTALTQEVGVFEYTYEISTVTDTEYVKQLEKESNAGGTDSLLEVTGASTEQPSTAANGGMPAGMMPAESGESGVVDHWGNASSTESIDKTMPKYKITISGQTESVKPIRTQFKIKIKTDYIDDIFTEVTVDDKDAYISISKMREWLSNSKDGNLIEIGKSLPVNTSLLKLSDSEFNYRSPYAEESETNAVSGIRGTYMAFVTYLQGALEGVQKMNITTKKDSGVYKFGTSMEDMSSTVVSAKSFINSIGSFYDSYANTLKSRSVVDDEGYSQLLREKDNFMSAYTGKWVSLNTLFKEDREKTRLCLSGEAREYTEGTTGEQAYEAALGLSFSDVSKDRHYNIVMTINRQPLKTAKGAFNTPSEITTDLKTFGGDGVLQKSLTNVFANLDFFNLFKKTELDSASSSAVSSFVSNMCDEINIANSGADDFIPVTSTTLPEFIKKYSEFKIDSGTNEVDKKNAELVRSYLEELSKITGNTKLNQVIEKSVSVDKYPEARGGTSDFYVIANVDSGASKNGIIQVDAYLLNTSKHTINIDYTKFSLESDGVKVPANYKEQLLDANKSFDVSKLVVGSSPLDGGYRHEQLYFVLPRDGKYILKYDGKEIGVLINK